MPHIKVNGCNLYYEDTGAGKETIVLAHGLLWSGKMFAAQVAHLKNRYRVITYDHRGQGQSEVTAAGYDMDSLAEDEAGLIKALSLAPCHVAGLSMGGFTGMRVAARHPELVKSLILMETSAQPEPKENVPRYNLLNRVVKLFGTRPVTSAVMKIMFGQKFLNDLSRKELKKYWKQQLQSNKKTITRAVEGVITRKGVEPELAAIKCPTLIIVGDQDVATVPDKARFIHQNIPQSKLVIIPGAGHTSSVEEPESVNKAIEEFLKGI
jgi:3-oxoadipate enol-lactonase